jgi:Flp pilus assembly pilin Flp
MRQLLARLWNEDEGAIVASEYLLVVTILVIGIIVGLASLREAINTELAELGNAFLALSQGYSFSGEANGTGSVDGSEAFDTPGLLQEISPTPPAFPSLIDQLPGN